MYDGDEVVKLYVIEDLNGVLIAYTKSKEILDKYKEQRDMKKINVRKSYVTRNELRKFTGKFPSKSLSQYELITTINHIDTITLSVVLTHGEMCSIEDFDYSYAPTLKKLLPITVFKKKYKKALKILEYHNLYRLGNKDIVEDFDSSRFKIDQIVALSLQTKTMKK